jgi:hypothetical protein
MDAECELDIQPAISLLERGKLARFQEKVNTGILFAVPS